MIVASPIVLNDLLDRRGDEVRSVVDDFDRHSLRKRRPDIVHCLRHRCGDGERVRRRRRRHADERAFLAVEGDDRVRALRSEFDLGYVAQPHDLVADRADRQGAEGFRASAGSSAFRGRRRRTRSSSCRAWKGSCWHGSRRRHRLPSRCARQGESGRSRSASRSRGRRGSRLFHAFERRESGLHDAGQKLRHLLGVHLRAREGQIHQGEGLAGALDDDRILRVARQLRADLLHLRRSPRSARRSGSVLRRMRTDTVLSAEAALRRDVVDAPRRSTRLSRSGR